MKKLNTTLSVISLLCIFSYGSSAEAEPSIVSFGIPHDVYIEGTYYGQQEIKFSLSVAQDNFVKKYSNGIVILGKKAKGEVVYHFIDKSKQLITKVSQGNLYRIGEFINWNSMVGLINMKPGTQLAKEKVFDDKNACTLYQMEGEEKVRVCMNDSYHVPVFIEQNGVVLERTTRMEPYRAFLDGADLLDKYLKEKYRYVDADDDIAPDAD